MTLLHFYGQFHPAFVHFPVALLLVAALAELIFWFQPQRWWHQFASFNLHVGALSALVATTMGWCLAATMGMEPELRRTLFWHRWLGTITAVWAVAAVLLWWWYELRSTGVRRTCYRGTLFGGALLVSVTGHLGGLLVYGLDYYTGPFSK